MIKDRPLSFTSTFQPSFKGVDSGPSLVSAPTSGNLPSKGAGDVSSFSREASESGGNEGISSLLEGLRGWGAPEGGDSRPAAVGETRQPSPTGNLPDIPPQVPMAIVNQVFGSLKAGGMATAGALHSLLSWGASELEKDGKIRPEFQEVLRETLAFAKENNLMSAEELAKWEARLFSGGTGGSEKGGAAKKGGDDGCACGNKKVGNLLDGFKGKAA
jgi:hypothetical protein